MTGPVPGPHPLTGYRLRDYDDLIAILRESQRGQRISQRISQRKLAATLGAHSSSVNEWLVGKTEPLGARLVALADALGYDLALIPRDTEPPRCARVGLHNCNGEWRNHDRANDLPEPGATTPQTAPASTHSAEPAPARGSDSPKPPQGVSATCCDLHGTNCESPSELCCAWCTEATHYGIAPHADGSRCVLVEGAQTSTGDDT